MTQRTTYDAARECALQSLEEYLLQYEESHPLPDKGDKIVITYNRYHNKDFKIGDILDVRDAYITQYGPDIHVVVFVKGRKARLPYNTEWRILR